MKLKLDFTIQSSFKKIELEDSIYLIGSCFSDEISKKLSSNKFQVLANPLGTIFNPISTFKIVSGSINPNDLVESEGVYFHWDAHRKISGLSKKEAADIISSKVEESNQFLSKSKWLIVTLGTAWAYRLRSTKEIVANCHKIDDDKFHKELLDVKTIVGAFREFKMKMTKINPYINIILTVSPVRHIKDGLIENNRSKARLIEAVHDTVERFENVDYFPSYELMMDDLRDYRFYHSDLIHPNQQSIDYIWDRFTEIYFSNDALVFKEEWKKVEAALAHQPFQPKSQSHQNFLRETLESLSKLNEKVDLSKEIQKIKSQLQ